MYANTQGERCLKCGDSKRICECTDDDHEEELVNESFWKERDKHLRRLQRDMKQ